MPGAVSYHIYRSADSSSANARRIGVTDAFTRYYNDTGAVKGTLYYYWVLTVTAIDTSDFGAADTGYVGLPSVSYVTATDGTYADKVVVSWGAVAGATSYEVWRGSSDDSASATRIARNVVATSYDDVSVVPGAKSWYWVKACDAGPGLFGASDSGYRKLSAPTEVAATTNQTDGVKVSSFGFDAEDSTEIIQRALDSGARTLVFDRQAGPWITRPLVARSNQELIFEDGVELVAKKGEFHGIRDYLFRCEGVSNLVIRGLGPKGGTFRMHKRDYQKPPYARSEWRYALRLCGVENVFVQNMRFVSSGGDGIVIGAWKGKSSKNVVIRGCVCDDNHRQGISLCGGEDILIKNTSLSNTCGTPPQAGIDFEPDHPHEKLARITLRNENADIGQE